MNSFPIHIFLEKKEAGRMLILDQQMKRQQGESFFKEKSHPLYHRGVIASPVPQRPGIRSLCICVSKTQGRGVGFNLL